jgi:hypothetical protein
MITIKSAWDQIPEEDKHQAFIQKEKGTST